MTSGARRIALLLESDGPGGAETVVVHLAQELLAAGHEVFPVTLANGQVWEQVEAVPSFQPRAGDPITVRQASLGSYLLRGRVGAPVRARRVR